MSEKRIDALEQEMKSLSQVMFKVLWTLESIERNITEAVSVKEDVITHIEKMKVTEKRLLKLEEKDNEKDKIINGINIKIALFSWGYWVVVFLANKFL